MQRQSIKCPCRVVDGLECQVPYIGSLPRSSSDRINPKDSSCLIKPDFWRDYHNEKNIEHSDGWYFLDDFSGDLNQRRSRSFA
jgi:hypothetical protein